jgi:hypothetical protein
VTLLRASLDEPWPAEGCDLVVLSEICYYLDAAVLRTVWTVRCRGWRKAQTVLAAHWRHPGRRLSDDGDHANDVIGATAGLHHVGGYRDADVVIEVFDTGTPTSVAARTGVPGT